MIISFFKSSLREQEQSRARQSNKAAALCRRDLLFKDIAGNVINAPIDEILCKILVIAGPAVDLYAC